MTTAPTRAALATAVRSRARFHAPLGLLTALALCACGGGSTTAPTPTAQTGAETTAPAQETPAETALEEPEEDASSEEEDTGEDEDESSGCVPVVADDDAEDEATDSDRELTPEEEAANEIAEAIVTAFDQGDAAETQRIARRMIQRFPNARDTVTAHGMLARIALEAQNFRAARPELEWLVAHATERRRLALARFSLAHANNQLRRYEQAIPPMLDAHRSTVDRCDDDPDLESFRVLLAASFAETLTDAPASITSMQTRLAAAGFEADFVSDVYGTVSRMLGERAKWTRALAVLRATPPRADASEDDCGRLGSILAVTQYGAGALTDDEQRAIDECGVTMPTPVVTPTRELASWVYEAREAIEECVSDARDASPNVALRLSIAAGRPRPRFARTGDRELDACLADALEEVGDPGFDVANPDDFYESPELDPLGARFGYYD